MSDLIVALGRLREERQRTLGQPSNFVAYTERDGGPWYAITGDRESYHGEERVAEEFSRRDDARRFLIFLLGGPAPAGWHVKERRDISVTLDLGDGRVAVAWTRACERVSPGRLADLPAA